MVEQYGKTEMKGKKREETRSDQCNGKVKLMQKLFLFEIDLPCNGKVDKLEVVK